MEPSLTRLKRSNVLKKFRLAKISCLAIVLIPLAIISLITFAECIAGDVVSVRFEYENRTLQTDPFKSGYQLGLGFPLKLEETIGKIDAYFEEISSDLTVSQRKMDLEPCDSEEAMKVSKNLLCVGNLSQPLQVN